MKILFFLLILFELSFSYGQYGNTDKFPVYSIKPDSITKGYVDQSGLKQGSFFSYNKNGTVNFIRTYKNDTLDGFLGCYSPDEFVNSEQFYKNGKYHGIKFDYYEKNVLKSQGFYNNGLKHGLFLEFYNNGNLKYEGFYQNDTLFGDEIYFHQNKIIRSIGNKNTGNYSTYDSTGRLENNIIYQNGKMIRSKVFYPDSMKQSKRQFVAPKILDQINFKKGNTLILEELYSNYGKNDREPNFLSGANIVLDDSSLVIHFEDQIFIVSSEGIYHCSSCMDYDSNNEIAVSYFGANREVYLNEKNEEDVRYFIRDEKISISNFLITVSRQELQCDDTGNNPVNIEYKSKQLNINGLKNIQLFEFDIDKNGEPEIYIISYESCLGLYKILRVSSH